MPAQIAADIETADEFDAMRQLALYRTMSLIRATELEIEHLHKRGRLSGSFHSSIGQEACAAGVCAALDRSDIVMSTHRGHGHAIAKGVPVEGLVAELFGRSSGVSGGRGGSMHIHHRASGFYGETAIVGGGLPWAVGVSWARRRRGLDSVAVAFIGDGGFAQGIIHEALLLARHWPSPLLVVCENNGLAHSMPSEALFGKPGSIAEIVGVTGITSRYVDGRDVCEVAATAEELVRRLRSSGHPALLECGVFRVRPHSLSDPDYRYRERGIGDEWLEAHDPIAKLRHRLEALAPEKVEAVDNEIAVEVAAAVEAAEAAAPTGTEDARHSVYSTPALDHG